MTEPICQYSSPCTFEVSRRWARPIPTAHLCNRLLHDCRWGHVVRLLENVKDATRREWYARQATKFAHRSTIKLLWHCRWNLKLTCSPNYTKPKTFDLDKTYRNIIKPAAVAAGLECVRADEIVHSGNINVPMYERLLKADVVVADVSTYNCNAFYELGVRHALRPYTTIINLGGRNDVPV